MWVKGELFDDFSAVAQSANGRLDRAAQTSLFDRLSWFELLWTHCTPGEFPFIARARAENCDAWLFLSNTDGRNATALANWYTLSYRPIFTEDAQESTKLILLTAIAKRISSGKSKLSTITLEPVPETDDSVDIILKSFRRGGWHAVSYPIKANWIVNVTGKTFAQFWSERPGEVRSTHDRKLKKSGAVVEILTRFDSKAWADYEDIYNESWKGEEGSPAFMKAMFADEGKAGALRIGICRIEGVAVAAQLWTVENGIAIIHKLAYRESASEHSPGTILTTALFKHVIDTDKVHLIDYGTGDDKYKQAWMEDRKILHRIELYNIKSFGGVFGALKSIILSPFKKSEL